jgi:hypothetical protein
VVVPLGVGDGGGGEDDLVGAPEVTVVGADVDDVRGFGLRVVVLDVVVLLIGGGVSWKTLG